MDIPTLPTLTMTITHRHLEVFRAVMRCGQITQAATVLHTSQPTVSRDLARLEHLLQLRLFDRVAGRLRPTLRALALMDEVERSYVGLQHVEAFAQTLQHFDQGRLSIACLPALAHALMPEAIQRFVAKHPQASVSISTHDSPQLEALLGEQRFDFGLVEQAVAPPGTQRHTLLMADEVAVLPAGHRLLSKRRLSTRDFEGEAFISFSPGDAYRAMVDAAFAAHRVERRLALDVDSAVGVCALVQAGAGLAIVNPLTAMAWAEQQPQVQVRPLSFRIPYALGVVTPEHRTPNPLTASMLKALKDTCQALAPRLRRLSGR